MSPRRVWLAALAACLGVGADLRADDAVTTTEFVFEQAPFASCHASTIAETPQGLVAAWFGGTAEGRPDVGIWVSRRRAGTWTAPVEVAKGSEPGRARQPCWNPVLYQADGGPLLLFYKIGASPGSWAGRLMTSDDAGATWSAPRTLPDGILGPIKDKPVRLADGTLLCPSSTEDQGWRAHMEFTPDLGRTWSRTGPLNDPRSFGLIQPTILKHADGQLEALCRSRQKRVVSLRSRDGGRTWDPPRATDLPNPNSGIDGVTLRDGRHLLVYNHTERGRSPLNVAVSRDGGAWRPGPVLEREPGEYSYPAVIQSSDGLVHVAYTWKRQRIKYVVIDPARLTADPPAATSPAAPAHPLTDVFRSGHDGYHTFRIPSIIVTPRGGVLAFCEGRRNGRGDSGDIDLVLRRSDDRGATWGPLKVVLDADGDTAGNPCPVVDRDTGTIWLAITRNLGSDTEAMILNGTSRGSRTVCVLSSADDGRTWSAPREITADAKAAGWTWYATGPGVGVQLRDGRLVIPCDHNTAGVADGGSHVIYSDDHGATWRRGGSVEGGVNECQVVERSDGSLRLDMRNHPSRPGSGRAVSVSRDRGLTWTPAVRDPVLVEPGCQASVILVSRGAGSGRDRLAFSNPASRRRERMTLRVSDDGGATWPVARVLHGGPAAYSCLTVLPGGEVGCLFECGEKNPYERVALARVRLAGAASSASGPGTP